MTDALQEAADRINSTENRGPQGDMSPQSMGSPQTGPRGVLAERSFERRVATNETIQREFGRRIRELEQTVPGEETVHSDATGPSSEAPSVGCFSGTAIVAGVITTGLNSNAAYLYVVVDLSTAVAEEREGPRPRSEEFPQNEVWYDKTQTFGDIILPRA